MERQIKMFDVYAIKLTDENVPQIIEALKPHGWTLDHLTDLIQYNTEDFGCDSMLFMKLFKDSTEIATFTDEARDDLDATHRYTDTVDPLFGIFRKIEKI